MDIYSGKIYTDLELQSLEKSMLDRMISVDWNDMTEKQKDTMSVSLHDNRSVLGKKRVKSRREKNREKRKSQTIDTVTER